MTQVNTKTKAFKERLAKLDELTLRHGNHSSFEKGHCALEVVAYIAGEEHSDHPECVCPSIAAFVRKWNDGMPDDATRTRVLKPLLPLLLNTRGVKGPENDKLLVRRSYMAIDWEIRFRTPAFLRAAGLMKEAGDLAGLPEITNARQLAAAHGVASAADSAASSAARSAADSAARSAARSAASSAARSAARSAAYSAAYSAASSAAYSAASSAAYSAVYSAAYSAAYSALRSAVDECHASGADLVRRMCALTEADVKDWSWE